MKQSIKRYLSSHIVLFKFHDINDLILKGEFEEGNSQFDNKKN